MRPRNLAASLVVALAVAGPLAAAPAADPGVALDRALGDLVATRGGPPGTIAVVQRGDRVEVHTAGVARVGAAGPPRANQRMKIASIAKAFSGAVALSLVQRHVLALDDTIGKRLPDLPSAWHAVTLRQLLGHTSGVPDFTAAALQQAGVGSLGRAPRPRALLSYVESRPLVFRPGSRYEYSNSDNIVVGLMVEAATGRSYEQELRRLVLTPLGLNRTSLPRGPGVPAPRMNGYAVDPPKAPEDVTTVLAGGWAWASGGIVSTPADLNRFIRGYIGGRLFGGSVQAQQRRVVPGGRSDPPGPGANAAGLALFRYRTRCGTVFGHTGNTLGYTQFAAATRDGTRSATLTVTAQLTDKNAPAVFAKVRRAAELAVCDALSPSGR